MISMILVTFWMPMAPQMGLIGHPLGSSWRHFGSLGRAWASRGAQGLPKHHFLLILRSLLRAFWVKWGRIWRLLPPGLASFGPSGRILLTFLIYLGPYFRGTVPLIGFASWGCVVEAARSAAEDHITLYHLGCYLLSNGLSSV